MILLKAKMTSIKKTVSGHPEDAHPDNCLAAFDKRWSNEQTLSVIVKHQVKQKSLFKPVAGKTSPPHPFTSVSTINSTMSPISTSVPQKYRTFLKKAYNSSHIWKKNTYIHSGILNRNFPLWFQFHFQCVYLESTDVVKLRKASIFHWKTDLQWINKTTDTDT